MGIPASRRSAIVFRRTCHTLGSGGLGFIEPSISWEVAAFSALLELANGVEAQPATVDATMINSVPRIIKADFLSGDIGTPVSRLKSKRFLHQLPIDDDIGAQDVYSETISYTA